MLPFTSWPVSGSYTSSSKSAAPIPWRDPAANLALDDHRVHLRAAIVDENVALDLELAAPRVHLDLRRDGPVAECGRGRIEVGRRLEAGRLARRQRVPQRRGSRHRLDTR